MLKRFLCLLTVVLLLPAVCLAQEFTMAGFDGQDSAKDWANNEFFTRMQERTGVGFTFQTFNDLAKWQEAKAAMFAEGGQLPDVLFKAALTSDELIRYTDGGQLIDLLPLLAEKIGLDPAVMAAPFIPTIVDVLSLLIYFGFASAILNL